ncbi:2-oxoacid:acceptor oxidoreductase subunit delta [Clostridia bacterium]|nr:2-oxoacid:acceptor oxidoreductase subunit delta [Clostridia bacterium]
MKFNIIFNHEECKGCELCIPWCKFELISFDKSRLNKKGVHPAMIAHPEKCVGCGNCALMCPDAIITIEKTEEDRSQGKEG